jgi:hypothetical protein
MTPDRVKTVATAVEVVVVAGEGWVAESLLQLSATAAVAPTATPLDKVSRNVRLPPGLPTLRT